MSVQAEKYIKFSCEKCGHEQYAPDSLQSALWRGMFVQSDRVLCTTCNHDNHVYIPPMRTRNE